MRATTGSKKKKIIEIAVLVFLIAATALLVNRLNGELSERMDILKQEGISRIETWIGRKLTYDSISPSVFMYFEIKNLRITPAERPGQPLLTLQRIKIHYNLLKLLFHPDPLASISKIDIRDSALSFEAEKDNELLDLFRRLEGHASKDYAFKIAGSNLTVRYITQTAKIELQDLFFQFDGISDGYSLAVKKGRASLLFDQPSEEPISLSSSLRLKGIIDADFEWFDAELKLNRLTAPNFYLARQSFHLGLRDTLLSLEKLEDKAAVDFQLTWDMSRHKLLTTFRTEDFPLNQLLTFRRDWDYLNGWADNAVTCDGLLRYDLETGKLSYGVDIHSHVSHESLPADVTVTSSLYGDADKLHVNPLWIISEIGTVYFTGDMLLTNYYPRGSVRFIDVQAFGSELLDAAIVVERSDSGIQMLGGSLETSGGTLQEIVLNVAPSTDRVDFSFSAALDEGSSPSGRVAADGTLSLTDDFRLDLSGQLDSIPVELLGGFFDQMPWETRYLDLDASPLRLTSDFHFATDFRSYTLSSTKTRVRDSADSENQLAFSVQVSEQSIDVKRVVGSWKGYDITGTANLRHEGEDALSFFSSFSVQGFPYHLSGRYLADDRLVLTGSHELKVEVELLHQGFLVDMEFEEMPIPWLESDLHASADISGYIGQSRNDTVLSGDLQVFDLPVPNSRENSVVLSVAFHGDTVAIDSLTYRDEFSSLEGRGSFIINEEGAYVGQLSLYGGAEALTADMHFHHGQIELTCRFENTPIRRLGETSIKGAFSGELYAVGLPQSPEFTIQAELIDGMINTDPIAAEIQVAYQGERLEVRKFDVLYIGTRIGDSSGWFEKDSGNFQLSSHLKSGYLEDALDCNITLSGNTAYAGGGGAGNFLENRLWAVAQIKDIMFSGNPRRDWRVQFYGEDGTLHFSGGLDNTLSGFLTSDWQFGLQLEAPFPLRGRAAGRFEGNQIIAEVQNFELNFPSMNEFTGDTFSFIQGMVYGDLSVSGAVGDPDFYGHLKAEDVAIRFFMMPEPTESFNSDLLIQEKELTFTVPSFRAGSATLGADARLYFSHWTPDAFEIDFSCDDPKGVHLVNDFGSVVLDGYARGDARVWGDPSGTWVDGTLEINYCRVTLSQRSGEEQEQDESGLYVDVVLKTGRRIEFLWPSVTFPVLRTYADKGSEVFVSYNSDSETTIIRGDIDLRGGEVFYFDRNFYVKEGRIQFNENQLDFDPRISVRSEIRERDVNNEEVKIYLIVDNDRLSEFSPRFEAIPGKSDLEIIALLGGPIRGQIEESGVQVSALILSTDILSQFGILRPLEQRVREVLHLDLFSIRTQVIQNMILGGLFESLQDSTVRRILGLPEEPDITAGSTPGSYLDNTTITFGKYIGNDLFLEMLLRLNADSSRRLESEMLLSLEWPTPFFELEWVINPTGDSLDEFLLNDNRLTLQWRYPY